jgi:hypothetical protein
MQKIFAPDFCGFFGEFLHGVFGGFLSATEK